MGDHALDPDPDDAARRTGERAERADEREQSASSARALPDYARRRLLLSASIFGALAGVISWGVGESKFLVSPAKHERFVALGNQIDWSTPTTKLAAERVTSARLHAVFGGL